MAIPVEEALKYIYECVSPKTTKILPLELALGHVIATDIFATHNLPPFDNSAMDGYAVKCSMQDSTQEVIHTIFAGDKEELLLTDGAVFKIMTGAKVPSGCEAIVPIEDITKKGDKVHFSKPIHQGAHIRLAGEDIQIDDLIIEKSTLLTAHQITLLVSQGITHVQVFAKPRVALFATGSELIMHNLPLGEHQLYNTNTLTFLTRAQELGCEVDFIGTAQDNIEAIKEMIETALNYDLIITSGGVSVGDADFTKEAFSHFDFEPVFEKVDIKPGKPTTFGCIKNAYVLNLPGNPLAAALNFELFAKAIILALSGNKAKYSNFIQTKVDETFALKSGKRSLLPGFFDGSTFAPALKFSPGMISPLANCNGFIMIDASVSKFESGAVVKFIPTRFSFTCKEVKDLLSR